MTAPTTEGSDPAAGDALSASSPSSSSTNVQVTAPDTAAGNVEISASGSDGGTVGVGVPGTQSSEQTTGSGLAVYDGTETDSSTVIQPDRGGVNFLTVLSGPAAPTSYSFPFQLPAGATLDQDHGTYVVEDSGGNIIATIGAPWARDANGTSLPTSYTLDGDTLVQTIDDSGAAFPVTADPALTMGAMTLTSDSVAMTETSSTTLSDGQVETTWMGPDDAEDDDVIADPGSTLDDNGLSIEIDPPEVVSDSWAAENPIQGEEYNRVQGHHCWDQGKQCILASGEQTALDTDKGQWYILQHMVGSVLPGAVSGGEACVGRAWNEFPGETGDSEVRDQDPDGTVLQSEGSYTAGFSGFGITLSKTTSITSGVFSGIWPHRLSDPAFGSEWNGEDHGGCTDENEGLDDYYDIHLGTDQDPYASNLISLTDVSTPVSLK